MQTTLFGVFGFAASALLLAACTTASAPTAAVTPTSTLSATLTPTPIPTPTATLRPSPTPTRTPLQDLLGPPTATVPAATTTPTDAPAVRQRQTADLPDEYDGYKVHFLYVLPSDGHDEQLDTNGWIATAVGSALRWLEEATSGRRLSVDTFRGQLDITFVRLGRTDAVLAAYDSRAGGVRVALLRDTLEVELRSLGFEHPRKLYAVYYGGGSDGGECFGGAFPPVRVGNIGIATVKLGTRCEEARRLVYPDGTHAIAVANFHELFHAMGAVGGCAPHHGQRAASGDYEGLPGIRWTPGHVVDDPQDIMSPRFPRALPLRFDAGRDDYFGHGDPNCLDLARSPFFLPAPAAVELPPLWPVGVARPRDCAEEPSLRLVESEPRSGIVFDNMSDATLQLFWLSSQGRTLRDTLRPWTTSYQREVVRGRAWLVADEGGNCLAIFVTEGTWTRGSIRLKR